MTIESLQHYIKYRLTELELYTSELLNKASKLSGEEYRDTLALIGDCSARKQELITLRGRFGGTN